MKLIRALFGSSLGLKFVMAITGAGLFLFVIGHLVGNLQMFLPPEAINGYSKLLHASAELLWGLRIGLLTLVALHIWSAVRLTRLNRSARPRGYEGSLKPLDASLASRTMLISGIVVFLFVVYHLLHYTAQIESVNGSIIRFADLQTEDGHRDVYAMLIAGFQVWYVSLFYILGVGLLCMHLSHGASSMFQSLGWKNHVYGPFLDKASKVIAVALFLGFISIPAAVLLLGHGNDYLEEATARSTAAVMDQGEGR